MTFWSIPNRSELSPPSRAMEARLAQGDQLAHLGDLIRLQAVECPDREIEVFDRQIEIGRTRGDGRDLAELETTVGVSRYAPLNAIAILVGSQTGRPGVMTQCAVEERRNLQLAIQGLVTYAETLSVYGTEPVFVDGDDTPWSKAFLASAYASRGVKVRFTSGGGSEALMGHAQGYSMLYLEARCLSLIRAAGSQGVQNGSIWRATLSATPWYEQPRRTRRPTFLGFRTGASSHRSSRRCRGWAARRPTWC